MSDRSGWERVRAHLRAELGEDVFQSWFKSMELEGVHDGVVHLSVPTRFLKGWVQQHYGLRLLALWRNALPQVVQVELSVRSALRAGPVRAIPEAANEARRAVAASEPVPARRPVYVQQAGVPEASEALDGSPLDARLTFASFMVGHANNLAHAAARQVVLAPLDKPAMFNPLYIHSGVGLGKTHLLQAIAWEAARLGRRVLYLTAEKFMFGFVAALKSQTALAYKEALRSIDVLIIDDLQFLHGKQTQAEFCHTLNALIDAGRHVVVAADRPPSEIETLDERVRSRLAGGLSVAIAPLDEPLRVDILRARVAAARLTDTEFEVPDPVLQTVARQVSQNGRDLEGAFNRLLAHHKLTGQPISSETAEEAIRDLARSGDIRRVRIEDIQRLVAKHYNVSRADMLSSRRTANVVKPRQVAMYLSKQLTLRSLPEIGRRFGGRDHTTVLHAVRKIDGLLGGDRSLADEIDLLKRMLQD